MKKAPPRRAVGIKPRKTRVTLLLEGDVWQHVRRRSEAMGRDASALVNDVLRRYVERRPRFGYMKARRLQQRARAEAQDRSDEMPLFRRLRRERDWTE